MKFIQCLLILVAMSLTSCFDSSEQSQLPDNPPFNQFKFSTAFDLPGVLPTAYSNLQKFEIIGGMWQSDPAENNYEYRISETTSLPQTTTMAVNVDNGDILISTSGGIARTGNQPDASYQGDPNLWSSQITFFIEVRFNPNSNNIQAASLWLASQAFSAQYDITPLLRFKNNADGSAGNDAPEWVIESQVFEYRSIEDFALTININDVMGTTFKN